MTFAEQLKAERERLGLTQAETAPILAVSPSWVDKVERNARQPHVLMQEGALGRLKRAKPKTK
ncbi:MAG: XRE family transcriptional regulator [Caulobacteraceae bacterium]|nr:XRE family transcriptional regulator [Caulobacteraceae bacterium]